MLSSLIQSLVPAKVGLHLQERPFGRKGFGTNTNIAIDYMK